MASNNDATCRFLLAILEQKNLKDIDWNLVAKNPVLPQPISNGHAARMRFSRLKGQIYDHPRPPRNRSSTKAKAIKSKKEPATKKDTSGQVKAEAKPLDAQQQLPEPENATLFKTEPQPNHPYTPSEQHPALMAEGHMHFSNRLLTPCSDTDIFGHAHHSLATSPVSEYHHEQPFNYSTVSAQCPGNEPNNWQQSPSPLFVHQYDVERYGCSPFGGQHALAHAENFGVSPGDTMVPDSAHVPIKHEQWDTQHTGS